MNKIAIGLLAFCLIGFTSCKDKDQPIDEVKQEIKDSNDAEIDELDQELDEDYKQQMEAAKKIPNFSDPVIQEFAQNYADYYKEIVDADNKGDDEQLRLLLGEGVEWANKAEEMTQKMNTEDKQKWLEWSSLLQTLASGN